MPLPASDASHTLPEWLQLIRADVYNILTLHKQVIIHQAKLAALCLELHAFHKTQIIVQNRQVSPGENQKLHVLSKALLEMRQVYLSLGIDHYVNSLIKQSSAEFIADLQKFRMTFNECTQALNFLKADQCPINAIQIRVDDNSDSQRIVELIDALLETPKSGLDPNQKQILQQRKEECIKSIEAFNKEEALSKKQKDLLTRNISAEEVTRLLEEFRPWNIDVNDFELQKKLGSGSFADVYLGYQKSKGILVGFKKLKTQQFKYNDFNMYKREISVSSQLKHFAILPFVGASIQHPYCLVTQFMSNGNLFERLHKTAVPFDATHKTICALGVAQGMAYMHSKNIIHRDLKSLNILLDSDDFPKICDFGMSREMGGDPLSGGIGTYRWMSPEVLESKDYDGKTDVYSYAVVLWELLTQDIPFHGLSDVQVGMSVVQKDARPIFPQNCPQKIVKLIKRCWDRDPAKRPDFETIAKMFECGAISFPGTNQDQVNAYINQFSTIQQQVGQFDPEKVSEKSADQIINDLGKEATQAQALAKLRVVADKPAWHPLLRKQELMQLIINLMNSCSVAQVSFDLVYIFYNLSQDNEMLNTFAKLGGTSALLELILKFGSTSMPNAIDALTAVLKIDNTVKLTSDHYAKLASFLGTTDIKIRISSTKLISLTIEKKLYTSDAALTTIVNSVLSNAILEAKSELLKPTLYLIKLLLPLERPAAHLARSKGPNIILLLLPHSDPQVVADSLDILRSLCQDVLPPAETIQQYALQFTDIIARNSDMLTVKALYLIGVLVHSPEAFKEFSADISGFKTCLLSKQASIEAYTLQLIFAFLSNQTSAAAFSELADNIVPLLASPSKGIAAIAASCLTVILMNKAAEYGKFVYCSTTAKFIEEALELPQLQQCGVRLAGVISMTFAGARFLDSTDIMSQIGKLLESEDQAVRKLAFMAFASFSTSLPLSKSAIAAIPIFINAIEDQEVQSYSLICITSITEVPGGPQACVDYLVQLSKLLYINDDETTTKTFDALINIFTDSSLAEKLEKVKGIKEVVEATKRFWDSPVFLDYAFQLLESLSTLHHGRAALRKYEVTKFAIDHIDDPKYSYVRRYLLRIIARTKALEK